MCSFINRKNIKPFVVILILFFIFFAPFQLAKRFYLHDTHFFPKASTQHGYLIQPPLNLNQLSLYNNNNPIYTSKDFKEKAQEHSKSNLPRNEASPPQPRITEPLKGKWILLYAGPSTCSTTCKKTLYQLQQIHIATGKDQSRVLRVQLTFDTPSFKAPGMLNLSVKEQEFAEFIKNLPIKMLALSRGAIYLVDPLGNVILSYTLDANPSGILKDLKHLLGVSQIG